jgi:hypothetical protein
MLSTRYLFIMDDNTIRKIIRESINSLLNEDKTVTFGGVASPTYGWAVIMCGGPGVGKTTSLRRNLPIHGKIISTDYFKEAYADIVNMENMPGFNGKKTFSVKDPYVNGEKKSSNKDVVWDLRNSRQAAQINRTAGELGFYDRQLNNFLKSNNNKDRLPNLIFDTAGRNLSTINKIFSFLKKVGGYKVSLVWVVANRKVAYASMMSRSRFVPDDAFHNAHNGLYKNSGDKKNTTVPEILRNHSSDIDEAWMIFNSSFHTDNSGNRIDRRPNTEENTSNVVKLEKINGTFVVPQEFGTSEIKPFMGGMRNKSLTDFVGQDVKGRGRRNPVDDEDLSYDVFPTSKNAIERARGNINNYPLKNVEVPYDEKGIQNRRERGMERLRNGKRANNHISLT